MPVSRLFCAAVSPFAVACSPQPAEQEGGVNAATNLAAAAPSAQASPAAAETPALPVPDPSPLPGETVGGDGSAIRLATLQPDDASGLEGELACSFAASGAQGTILLGRADVGKEARAFAVVRNAGVLERLAGTQLGGFGAMEKSATFGGKGLTIRVTPQGRLETGNESVAQRAELLVQRADGAERKIEGIWTCGP